MKIIKKESSTDISRRHFIKTGVIAGTALTVTGSSLLAEEKEAVKPDLWVIHGKDKKKLIAKCMELINKNGGLCKKNEKLTLKVNAAFDRKPDQGANTHPELVDAFLAQCKKAGITELTVAEHGCQPAKKAFVNSGILDAVKKNKVKIVDLKSEKKSFVDVKITKGKNLKTAKVAKEFTECDVLVNMPVAKHHSGATLSIGLKNWMGAVQDRRWWHRNDLHQCIADFATFIKPKWTIVDATRIMMDKGPMGPTKNMKYPDLIIVSQDPVAADAYASSLFLDSPYKVKYLKIAEEMGVGVADIKKINVIKMEV